MQRDVEKITTSGQLLSLIGNDPLEAVDIPPKIVLALIDNKPLTLVSFTNFIYDISTDYLINPFSTPDELINTQTDETNIIHLILFNIGSGRLDSDVFKTAIPKLKTHFPEIPLVLIADCEEPCCFIQAINMGVHGYITTSLIPAVVMAALKLVLEGGIFAPVKTLFTGIGNYQDPTASSPEETVENTQRHDHVYFTPRQLEVLEHVKLGEPNKVIAFKLKMQECTVKVHIRDIMKKLNATNRTQLVYNANRISAKAEGDQKN